MQNSDLQKYLKENPLLEDKNSNSKDFLDLLSEGLTEDESKAVLDKYKKRYAAVLKSNPDFIKKYPNPDKVIYGMVMNEVKRLREKLKSLPEENKATEKLMDDWGDKLQLLSTIDSKDEFLDLLKGVISIVAKTSPEFIKSSRFIAAMGDLYNQRKDLQGLSPEQEINEKLETAIKEVFSEKQRKYMCVMAQPGAKRPKGLSKADAKEMCADTNISKAKQEESQIDEIMEELERKSTTYEKVAKFIEKELESNNVKNKTDLRQILRAIQNKKTYALPMKRQNMLQNLMRQAKKGNMNENRLTELVKSALMGPIKEGMEYDADAMEALGFDLSPGGRYEAFKHATEELGIPANEILGKLSDDDVYNAIHHSLQIMDMYNIDESKKLSKKMDPVGKEDPDVNNDGKVNKTDDYLLNRRKAIKKAIGKKKVNESISGLMNALKAATDVKSFIRKVESILGPQSSKEEKALEDMYVKLKPLSERILKELRK